MKSNRNPTKNSILQSHVINDIYYPIFHIKMLLFYAYWDTNVLYHIYPRSPHTRCMQSTQAIQLQLPWSHKLVAPDLIIFLNQV